MLCGSPALPKRKETNGEIVDEVIVSFFGFSIASTGLLEVSVLHVSVLHTARAYIKPRVLQYQEQQDDTQEAPQ